VLLCGEESATCVFERERCGAGIASNVLSRIALEEEVHRRLLLRLHKQLPLPPDITTLRRRAAGLYFRLGAESSTGVFSKIVELDSCVCILLNELILHSDIPREAYNVRRLLSMIRKDESGHVRACRGYLSTAGGAAPELADSARNAVAKMMGYAGATLEQLGVDTDRLIGRIRNRKTK
jgi:hypothetical protein